MLKEISHLYLLHDYDISLVKTHEGSRNIVFLCYSENSSSKIIRISFLPDRKQEDYLAELEFLNYLANNGANVSRAIFSRNKKLLETITIDNMTFYISVFYRAKGKKLSDNNYIYRDDAPISEYFYNTGKVLGKIHDLSKSYRPTYERYSFLDKYCNEYIQQLIPDNFIRLKQKMQSLLTELHSLPKDAATYGTIHFDYNDGNYNIDFTSGHITVFDFDNSCRFWYMYDLASLWLNGVGWIQFEEDVEVRRAFMNDYFETVINGYRSETHLADNTLNQLALFIEINIMESILDSFEQMKRSNIFEYDEELKYRIRCLENNIEFFGFFDDVYRVETPFKLKDKQTSSGA